MSEECIYYRYDGGYTCRLKKLKTGYSSIDSDTVHRYCWDYQYEDCQMYKNRDESWEDWNGDKSRSDWNGSDSKKDDNSSDSGGCFLTSACVVAKGLPDDCRELTALRSFRDGYMRSTEQGRADILEYYSIAPIIVERIKRSGNCVREFERIYQELVLPCVSFIEEGRNEEAYSKYKNYTKALQKIYGLER